METIKGITEEKFSRDGTPCEGWIIKTDIQTIRIGISNEQSCCENWGYIVSHDEAEIPSFIGSGLLSIRHTDLELGSSIIDRFQIMDFHDHDHILEVPTMFVTLETTAGTLQFVAYNDHNGYYGHEAVVISMQLNLEVLL